MELAHTITNPQPVCRYFEADKDYETVKSWWEAHNWPVIPKESLSSIGVIIEDVCAGWLYTTNSDLGWLEWIISNPKISKETRDESLNTLISSLVGISKIRGMKHIFTSSNNNKLIQRYTKHGFNVLDKNVTHLLRSES